MRSHFTQKDKGVLKEQLFFFLSLSSQKITSLLSYLLLRTKSLNQAYGIDRLI